MVSQSTPRISSPRTPSLYSRSRSSAVNSRAPVVVVVVIALAPASSESSTHDTAPAWGVSLGERRAQRCHNSLGGTHGLNRLSPVFVSSMSITSGNGSICGLRIDQASRYSCWYWYFLPFLNHL